MDEPTTYRLQPNTRLFRMSKQASDTLRTLSFETGRTMTKELDIIMAQELGRRLAKQDQPEKEPAASLG